MSFLHTIVLNSHGIIRGSLQNQFKGLPGQRGLVALHVASGKLAGSRVVVRMVGEKLLKVVYCLPIPKIQQ